MFVFDKHHQDVKKTIKSLDCLLKGSILSDVGEKSPASFFYAK